MNVALCPKRGVRVIQVPHVLLRGYGWVEDHDPTAGSIQELADGG